MPAEILNTAGLICGLGGSLLIYFFGIPPRLNPEGQIHFVLARVDEDEIKKARSYGRKAAAGVILLIASFALQLVALVWPHLPA